MTLTSATEGAPAAEGSSTVSLLRWDAASRTFAALVDGKHVSGHAMLTPAEADAPLEVVGTTVDLFGGESSARVLVSDVAQQARQRLSAVASGASAVATAVTSPMPGKIVRVLVAAGQPVAAGEALIVLEAMKMEHTMKAPADAVVAGVHAKEGDVVGNKALLLSFETPPEASTEAASAA